MNEGQNTEWKASWQDEYMKWLCGFANAQGGVLEVGRDDDGQAIGVENADRLMEELPNKFRDLLGIVAGIELLHEDGRPYLRIAVEPYPVPISYRGEYHYRSGSTKQVLRGAALDRFLMGKMGRCWDSVHMPNVGG
ncbi:MAG: ATP-binding protein [Gammaproteobacteria bacterium]|nr:ATP-binding protein [Gammaproteobacteria bacterium]